MWIMLWIVVLVLAEYGLAILVGRFLSLSNSRHAGPQGRRQKIIRPSRVVYGNASTRVRSRPATSPGSW